MCTAGKCVALISPQLDIDCTRVLVYVPPCPIWMELGYHHYLLKHCMCHGDPSILWSLKVGEMWRKSLREPLDTWDLATSHAFKTTICTHHSNVLFTMASVESWPLLELVLVLLRMSPSPKPSLLAFSNVLSTSSSPTLMQFVQLLLKFATGWQLVPSNDC
jgi:hypothetical protein